MAHAPTPHHTANLVAHTRFFKGDASTEARFFEVDHICPSPLWTVCVFGRRPGYGRRAEKRKRKLYVHVCLATPNSHLRKAARGGSNELGQRHKAGKIFVCFATPQDIYSCLRVSPSRLSSRPFLVYPFFIFSYFHIFSSGVFFSLFFFLFPSSLQPPSFLSPPHFLFLSFPVLTLVLSILIPFHSYPEGPILTRPRSSPPPPTSSSAPSFPSLFTTCY